MEENPTTSLGKKKKVGGNGGLPSPREMITHYESKGMDAQEASLKVIEDLQNALFRRLVLERKKMKKAGGGGDSTSSSQKLDVINSRLINLDLKLDSKPGYPQTLAIGVASGTLLHGIGTIIPHLAASVAHIWNSGGRRGES